MLASLLAIAVGAITVEDPSGCLPVDETRAALERDFAASAIRVVGRAGGPGTLLELEISGEISLDRTFEIAPEDCASAGELVRLVVARALSPLPHAAAPPAIDAVAEAPRPVPVPVPVVASPWRLVLLASAQSRWLPAGADAEIGLALHHETGLIAGLAVRAATPDSLGNGSFVSGAGLAGVGWRFARGGWALDLEARGGVALVAGYGFARNHTAWLPWVEARVIPSLDLGAVRLGLPITASPLAHDVANQSGSDHGALSQLRVGLGVEIPLASEGP